MKKSKLIFAATFIAVSGLVHAAGAMKTYTLETAFAADDMVDWIGLGGAARGERALQLSRTFSGAKSANGSVVVSGGVSAGSLQYMEEGGRLLAVSGNPGPLTLSFTSGPVMGVGVQIRGAGSGPFTGRMSAYDAAGNPLETVTVAASDSAQFAGSAAPFMAIRSSVKEIARVDIDAPGASGFALNGLRLGLNPSIASNTLFVNQLFQDLYGRAPSTAELAQNATALDQGATTRAQVATTLFSAPEFHDNGSYLGKCYLALLKRDADFSGWSQIFKVMHDGATQDDAFAAFAGTPQYAAEYADSLSDGTFVTRLHQNILGREPERSELDYWASNLAQGGSRVTAMKLFLLSPEFEVRISSRVNVSLMYLAFLRHGGDAAGMARWTEKLKSGTPLSEVIGSFISMPEYAARF